jgi:hypothetical protein
VSVAIGRDARRAERRDQLALTFGARDIDAALDALELMDFAWHDCYGDVAPPDRVLEDVLLLADGDLAALVRQSRLAVIDSRDVHVAADAKRAQT